MHRAQLKAAIASRQQENKTMEQIRDWFGRFRTFTRLQWLVHMGVWVWTIYLIVRAATGNLTYNPIQAATQFTGKTALILLTLSLFPTPLNTLFNLRSAIKVRRTLGLYAFWYAAAHFMLFAGVDYRFNLKFIWLDSATKPYIWVGLAALLILLALAVTSFDYWKRQLRKNWKRLHRLSYMASLLVVLHYAWVQKGNILTFSGNLVQPLLFAVLIVLLLVARIPGVRRRLVKLRSGVSQSVV